VCGGGGGGGVHELSAMNARTRPRVASLERNETNDGGGHPED